MIALRNEWWWPEVDRRAHPVIMGDAPGDIAAFLAFVPGRDLIVQAGGNVGIYPAMLAQHFKEVLTFEPDALNYQCLKRNLASRDIKNVAHTRAAMGEDKARGAIEVVEAHNVGAHRVNPQGDDFEIIRLDDLPLRACDAIWLDIEGYELSALKGAEATIDKFSPVVGIEDKGLGEHYGIRPGEVGAWLVAKGYAHVGQIGNDKIFKRPS